MAADQGHLLFVDDEPALRTLMAERLAQRGFDVVQAESGEKALGLLEQFAFDVVVTDLRMPGVDGTQVIRAALERYPGIVVIVITGYGTVRDAVDAIKRGAADFVAKPFQFDELMHVLQKALEQRRLTSENAYLRSQLEERYSFAGILGKSRAMLALFQMLETVARASSTILITGETGTGKEVVARAIHHNSPRRLHRFVAINCSAIPETLLEAELFGHVRGAFTGAVGMRQGRFEQAHKGTIFLDEVGTMSVALQMKLLRALQEREFERVGDSQPIKVDVRVIAATNADLAGMVRTGAFREDLYYRLNVIPIHLPPLRDRRDDIPLLAQHFLEKFTSQAEIPGRPPVRGAAGASSAAAASRGASSWKGAAFASKEPASPAQARASASHAPAASSLEAAAGRESRAGGAAARVPTLSQGAMRRLMAYAWPGNVRQLENAIERAVALGSGRAQIEVQDLPPEIQAQPEAAASAAVEFPDDGIDLPAYLSSIERDLIQRSLERTGGNRNKAAELLRIKRTTLVEKLKRLRFED
jgi:two-component system response regulator PilR (NtrC family)